MDEKDAGESQVSSGYVSLRVYRHTLTPPLLSLFFELPPSLASLPFFHFRPERHFGLFFFSSSFLYFSAPPFRYFQFFSFSSLSPSSLRGV